MSVSIEHLQEGTAPRGKAVVAGHLCLDLLPDLQHLPAGRFKELLHPGRLITAGPVRIATGGVVSNTGLALHRLGIPTRLCARVGGDPFGTILLERLRANEESLLEGIRVVADEVTSYSIIISLPGVDRIFFHCSGANDDFGAEDVDFQAVDEASLFHFGYPSAMRRLYRNHGSELVNMLARARNAGVSTSLDMTLPDPLSESGMSDWTAILSAALPHVDLFLPCFEELLFMLRRSLFEQFRADGEVIDRVTPELLEELADEVIGRGAAIVGLKLGQRGFYLRTAAAGRLAAMGRARPANWRQWANRQLWAPCFAVDVVGTTGAGDTTNAGFLAGLLRGLSIEASLQMAAAVGACCVEAEDALSGLLSWDATLQRMKSGWKQKELALTHKRWHYLNDFQLWEAD